MNPTYWDDATHIWQGTAGPYLLADQPGAADGDVIHGHTKPLLLSPEWLSVYEQSADSHWSAMLPPLQHGPMEPVHPTPPGWPTQGGEGGAATAALASAVQQLTQAMAVFAVPVAGLVQPAEQALFAPVLQMAVDGSLFA